MTSTITPRQREVLALLVQGKRNKTIARNLGLSENTVKVHLLAVYKQLRVKNRTQAIIEFIKLAQQAQTPRDVWHLAS